MRRPVIASAILLLLLAAPASAQLRLAGGISVTDFFGDDVLETDSRQGLDLGASMGLLRLGRFQLRAEGYYRQKGARNVLEFQEAAQSGQPLEFGLDYVEVPILLRFNLPGLGGFAFPYLQGGPAFAWQIDCGYTIDAASGGGQTSCDDLQSANLEETFKDYEQGLIFGGGIDIPVFGIGSVGLDARYTRGLSRLSEGTDIRNKAISVMLGYSFGVPFGMPGGAPAVPTFPGGR